MSADVYQEMEQVLRELVVACHARDGSDGVSQDFERYERALAGAQEFLTNRLRDAKRLTGTQPVARWAVMGRRRR